MLWLQSLDLATLRLVRETLRNPLFDWLMPFLSGNILFIPALALAGGWLALKEGIRGRLCLLMLAAVLLVGDSVICNTLKKTVGRPRPAGAYTVEDQNVPADQSRNGSMPSSHAANCFAATMVLFLYYRRSLPFMLTLAAAVGYSRVYKGAHYPTDVLTGAALGAIYAVGIV